MLVAALSQGQSLPEALKLASAAGALACMRLGAQSSIPTQEEVVNFLSQQAPATPEQVAQLKQFCGFND
jgi:ribokinase